MSFSAENFLQLRTPVAERLVRDQASTRLGFIVSRDRIYFARFIFYIVFEIRGRGAGKTAKSAISL